MSDERLYEILFELHIDTPRQGPGTPEDTQKALSMLPTFRRDAKILDIGSGTGAGTAELWRHTEAEIVAVDFFDAFIETLRKNAQNEGCGDRVTGMVGDMTALSFEDESFDAIWAEGSIFIIGFENGLKEWRRFLKPGGVIAITDAAWLKNDVPEECFQFWQEMYPAIQDSDDNLAAIEKCGYKNIAHFTLPEKAWENYYAPLRKRVPQFLKKYRDDEEALGIVKQVEQEIKIFDKYAPYYGYVFYLASLSDE